MTTGTTVSILPCGAMTADLTWLLLAPGRAIRNRQNKHLPAEWVDVPTHCVLVDTPDGKLLWDTSCPRDWETRWAPTGLQFYSSVEKLRGIATEANATVVFGHDPDQIKELRTAPEGSYR
jgi:N-acyl homoserine lactone hydrolase